MAEGGSVTNRQTAEKIAAIFAGLGLSARVEMVGDSIESARVVVRAGDRDVEAFLVFPSGIGAAKIDLLRSAMRPMHFDRPEKGLPKRWREVKERCERIVSCLESDTEQRTTINRAQAVADDLKRLGLVAVVVSGRVSITLDLSPEYAAEVGPKIAAVMSEKKEGAT
jgi:hypothetical protein